jgi:hypothetical protein
VNYGVAYRDFPQIDIYYFKYDGEMDEIKKFAKRLNLESLRLRNVCHELRHIDNFRYILHVPKEERGRLVSAANEFFATVAENLGYYAELNGKSKNWNKSFRGKINVWDVNYKLPKNTQEIVDSAIVSALDKLENNPLYRKEFIEKEHFEYHPSLEGRAGEEKNTAADAVNRMKSAFMVNGKLTDIFSLASEKVRERAENFIDSNDEDMRLIIYAHKNNIKF